jgi:hypothetical protein
MAVVSVGLVVFVYLSNRRCNDIEKITFHDGSFFENGLELDMYFLKRVGLTDVKGSVKVNDMDNLNSTRNLKTDTGKDIKTNENVLILGENKSKDNKDVGKNILATITPCEDMENPVKTKYKSITYNDYQKIPPQKLLKYDKRDLIRYFKDELIHNNCIVKLFTKHSLIDTRVISTFKLLFKINLIFGLNALSITDSMIESRSLSATRVYTYVIIE